MNGAAQVSVGEEMAERAALEAADAAAWIRCARAGDFERAWLISDRIRARNGPPRDWSIPRHEQRIWNGTALDGRSVLVRCYHGLGDTIQFIRYASLLRATAREVIVWAQPRLIPLLGTVRGIDRLLPLHNGTPAVDFEVDIEVMELPYAFRTTLASVPSEVPYLSADGMPVAGARPRIGLVWRAGDWNGRRSIPFGQLAPLLESTRGSWHSLQVDARADERHPALHRLDTRGIVRTAACMRGLDLVITIDSMTAHLAGALNVPVWTLLAYDADWRWMDGRADTPWYPAMRLFRQRAPGDWGAVVQDVRAALAPRA